MTEEVKIEVIQPWSNLIYKITMPDNITQGLIEHTDKMREDPNTPSYGQSLVGQVDEELEINIRELPTNILNFLINCSREWLFNQFNQGFGWEPSWNLKKEDLNMQFISMWTVSQKDGEYNPIHTHPAAAVSGVLYLKIPEYKKDKKDTTKHYKQRTDDGSLVFTNSVGTDRRYCVSNCNVNPKVGELYIFAGVLNKFQVDQRMAHTALENEAKIQMKNISMSVLEEFAAAVRQRNLEYFTEVLDIPLTNTFDAGGISTAQRYLKYWIAEVGNEIIIPMSQFKLVYDILTDSRNKLSTRDFTKAMSRLNIKTSRKRVSADKNASIPRGVVLTWKLDDNIRTSLIKEHFEDRDNLLLQKTS